ncbi:MAG TPA: cysteine desulfurase family protein [Ruminiclostridium sp.]|nr:cysteine desulfurase family protein [Ruminiclostridium sp.]
MIYLDYAANTPIDENVLETYFEISKNYIANPNSPHALGALAKEKLDEATATFARLLGINESEIIYTSGATESNNLALKGIAGQYKKYGRHIITTYLEHSSVNGAAAYLQSQGFEIDYVEIDENGLVDIENLKELLRDDTILVSICMVDSEIGIKQHIGEIAKIIAERPHCYFHVDATQAVGKIAVPLNGVDLMTFAPHKFFGPNGFGVLIKKDGILLEPLINGGISTTAFRSGTPALPLIVSSAKALEIAFNKMDDRYEHAVELNKLLREKLSAFPKIRINSTKESVPFILNISAAGVKAEAFQAKLSENEIYLSTKSACCAPGTVSRPVYALTKDRKVALSTLRISISHLTSKNDIETFLNCFESIYKKLAK